ncbi:uncharacterized protein LOC118417990 [Branchiostoma floridae]|uniref:Uncharacterized protein LOC118417990 n=1 Tax=Branchiostoma floridae TaxID=7739 RepID=C3YFC9_BRAFL|nr:uncharacterized protein LOC118417990 [Branchiostoma floridae]|eukprot:XP_002604882.1 hypothetical protein BRAFLDRAFT_77284 [Branchiostoma floridae]
MYAQAEPVRSPFSRPDSGQTSGPPSQSPPVHQGGSRGRVRHSNDKWQGDQEKSSDTYEEAEAVKRYATYTSADRTYPDGASGRRARCSFIHSHRSYLAAGIAVLLSLVAVGLAPLTVMNKEEISQLSATVETLKRDQDDMRQLSATVEALKLKRDRDDMLQLFATVDALKRDRDYMSTTVEALKRNQDDIRQLSATVDALKCNQDDMSTTVDALKRDRDYMSTTVEALKRNQDDMSTTIDALKRSQDDMSTTVDALKRNQDDMSTTVDALMRD